MRCADKSRYRQTVCTEFGVTEWYEDVTEWYEDVTEWYEDVPQSLRTPFLPQSLRTLNIDTSRKQTDQTRPTPTHLWA